MNYGRLIISLALPQLAGLLGSFFTFNAIPTWYATLAKPIFSPPNWLFGPVWLILYLLMGISAYIVWQQLGKNPRAKIGLKLFWLQLLFNAIWTPAFFGLQNIAAALGIIFVLWILIAVNIAWFWRISKIAAILLLPYLFWVSFAMILNYSLWKLN